MLYSKRRHSKLKKLQDARRAYVEQLAFIRQFRKDEDGGLIVLTLLLLISMLVVGGMAVDFMRYESERTKLQSVSDRAVLAAANLNQERDAESVITEFFEAEGYAGAIVGEPDIDKNANGSTITLNSRIDVDTFYLRLIGMDTLSAPASASAIEGTGNVEVSLVLDISGSMGSSMYGPVNQLDANGDPIRDADGNIVTVDGWRTRMFFLQQAAKQFVADLLLPEYEDRISINLITYSQHVALGDDLYTALKTTPDSIREDGLFGSTFGEITDNYAAPFTYRWVNDEGEEVTADTPGATMIGPYDSPIDLAWADGQEVVTNPSRCVLFEDDEFETLTFDVDRVYTQVEHVDFYTTSYSFPDGYEPCASEDYHKTILLSQDVELLQNAIDQFTPTLNTSIHRGAKWGASLLDPSMRDLIGGIPTIDDAFRGSRPADYNDRTTSKYLVIMTDGLTVSSRRVKRSFYGDPVDYYDEFEEWQGFAESSAYRYAQNDGNGATDYWNMTTTIGTETELNEKLSQICELAGDQVTEVYTISMGIQNATMTDCASKPGNAFMSTITNDPDEPGLDEIFRSISDQITALRLAL